ncbi:precorrin-6y C5,15-methyltransferase (decarboxylating) subunit CbiE [Aminipila butyrica]|uniref:Precorrin-6y C5,15-methyltransferase (Decarboxylating) subunit CbiE n=1 Tax=Aminipila butyrica TaxID=433296 RepID=A0A858BWN6_9FIRM|nr:precorrin-6y C5,15-methyltransferase (decarboxylating) subunit CbiE [Aminipila butyrica]QIB69495.1 precorrin-6y C5,15-methyltransferase (decarboxylating) subunit CbiE [Aminipila butyrica]
MKKIYIIGIGMGNPDTLTVKGKHLIEKSQALIGARRMVDSLAKTDQQTAYAISPENILTWLEEHPDILWGSVLLSGDIGFFSGAKKLRRLIKERYGSVFGNEQIAFEYIPGISSLGYFACAIGLSWEDAELVSLHGRQEKSAVQAVFNHPKTFFLTDGTENTVQAICNRLVEAGLGDAEVFVGERLSYVEEQITKGTALELGKKEFEPLSVMMVLNPEVSQREKCTLGIGDEEFIRGNVPMTKEEVRTVTVSKMNLRKGDVVYDIGAGTGSVSVELALACSMGAVYAVETNQEGLELIRQNKEAFGARNLHVVSGMAPAALEGLPPPDKAFIGGSKGNLDEIIQNLLLKNSHVRIIINVVALESLGEAMSCIKKYGFQQVDITQLNVAKAKTLGSYNLMMGQNPVYIIAVQKSSEAV